MSTKNSYSLYQTFNSKIPKADLKQSQKKKLKESIANLTPEQNIALIRLMFEHARLNKSADKKEVVSSDKKDDKNEDVSYYKTLYKSTTSSDNVDIEFDIDNLPLELRWILWKFVDVCESNKLDG